MLRTLVIVLTCWCSLAAWSIVAASSKPDALVKAPGQVVFTGGNVYNDIAAQTVSAGATATRPATFWLRIENDGAVPDMFVAQGTGDGDGWTARYYDAAGVERTGLFTQGAAIFQLAAGASVEARVEIYASPTLATQPNRVFSLAVAAVNAQLGDAVYALVYRMPALSAVSLAGPSSPLPEGLPITLTATPTGGDNLQYRFWMRPATQTNYTMLRDWGGPVYSDWHPAASSTQYIVKAQAREVGGTKVLDTKPLYYLVKPGVSALAIIGSPASPSVTGRRIVLSAVATNGANLLYKFVTTRQDAIAPVVTFTRDYGTSRSTWWTPTEAGTYTVTAYAKEVAGGDPATTTATYEIRPAISALALKVNNPPAMPDGTYRTVTNMSVELQATATGGANLEYWWQVGTRATTAVPTVWDTTTYAYGKSGGILVLKPQAAGYYYFTAYAREKGTTNGVASGTVRVQVNAPVTSYTAAFGRNPSTGVVTIRVANVVGGAAPQWKVWVRKQGTLSWGTPIREYALPNLIDWTPADPGVYEVSIAVKELGSKAASFDLKLNPFTYTVE